jgi:trehalose-phosphatase
LEQAVLALTEDQIEMGRLMEPVAAASLSALLLDYDGTLAPFSTERMQAFPYSGITHLLRKIIASGRTRVVIISGRPAREVVALLGINPHPEIWGSHGQERMLSDGTYWTSELAVNEIRGLEEASRWLARQHNNFVCERKPGGVAVHWRGLPEAQGAQIRNQVLRGWFPIAQTERMEILEFDGGVELRVRSIDKGTVVRQIVDEMPPDAPVFYLGDDFTDERAFGALNGRGVSVLVRPMYRKTTAQYWLRPPAELLAFLERWRNAGRDWSIMPSASFLH